MIFLVFNGSGPENQKMQYPGFITKLLALIIDKNGVLLCRAILPGGSMGRVRIRAFLKSSDKIMENFIIFNFEIFRYFERAGC